MKKVDIPDQGMLFAVLLDGNGGGCSIGWEGIHKNWPKERPVWIHLERNDPKAVRWLQDKSGLRAPTIDALLVGETRPRSFNARKGTVAILRGVNLNPGKDPDDMLDLRLWSDGKRLITLRTERVQTVRDILVQTLEESSGPQNIEELFTRIIMRLNERIEPCVEDIDSRIDMLEDVEMHHDLLEARRDMNDLRSEVTILRRYLSPQRTAMTELLMEPPEWAGEFWHGRLREASDLTTRLVEELDMSRERLIAIREDLTARRAEEMNRTMYLLSIVSAIFLPLAFLTGLFGVNIGGMPGVDNPASFALFCIALAVIAGIEVLLFRFFRWF